MLRSDVVILIDEDDTVLVTGIENVVSCAPAVAVIRALATALDSLPPSITEGMHPDVQWIRDHWFRDLRHGGNLYIDLPATECDVITTYERNYRHGPRETHE